MPDPNAHADDMKSPAPEPMPPFWWLNPWHHAKRLSKTVFALRDYADAHDDRLTIAKSELQEAGESIAMLQRKVRALETDRDAFLSKVHVTLESRVGILRYEDTIDLVRDAADKIKTIRADRDEAYRVNKNVNEALSKLTGTIAAARMATPDTCLDGHGPESWMKNTVALLDRVTKERDEALKAAAGWEKDWNAIYKYNQGVKKILLPFSSHSRKAPLEVIAKDISARLKAKPAKKKGGRK